MSNLNGMSIGEEMFSYLIHNFPANSILLEFGAGKGTIELAKFFNVISIENDKNWINLSDKAEYHLAPLKNEWYDTKVVLSAIEGKDIQIIIVDGPLGEGKREGVINFIQANPKLKTATIIVDDIQRRKEQELSVKLSYVVGRKNTRYIGHEKSFDVI